MNQKTKLALAVIILIVAVGCAAWQFTRPGPVSHRVRLVCADTGKTYTMSRKELIAVPMRNPDTGEFTLLPCHEDESGRLVVNTRYRGALDQLGEKNRYVDRESLAVRAP